MRRSCWVSSGSCVRAETRRDEPGLVTDAESVMGDCHSDTEMPVALTKQSVLPKVYFSGGNENGYDYRQKMC